MKKHQLIKRSKKAGVWILRIVAIFVALLIVIVLLLNIPAVQTEITSRISKRVSEQTGSEFSVGSVKIAFPKTVQIKDIYVADQQQDTLLFLGAISVNVDLLRLISQEVRVRSIRLDQMVANVTRASGEQDFNYQFIVDAFTPEEKKVQDEPSAWEFSVKNIYLNQFRILYLDAPEGHEARLDLGAFSTQVAAFDLDVFRFEIKEITLKNTNASYTRWSKKPSDNSQPSSSEADLPSLALGRLNIENVTLNYTDSVAEQFFEADIADLLFTPNRLDLNEKQLDLGSLSLSGSNFDIQMAKADTVGTAKDEAAKVKAPDVSATISDYLPEWRITMDDLLLDQIGVRYLVGEESPPASEFNPNHIALSNLNLNLSDVDVKPEAVELNLKNLAFADHSGFAVDKFAIIIQARNQHINVDDLVFQSGKSRFLAHAEINFETIGTLTESPGNTDLSLTISDTQLHADDFLPLLHDLIPEQFHNLALSVALDMHGKVNDLNVEMLEMALPGETRLAASAVVQGLPDTENLAFDLQVDPLYIRSSEIVPYIDTSQIKGLVIPDHLQLTLNAQGRTDSLTANVDLNTSYGKLLASAFYHDQKNLRDTFSLDLRLDTLALNKLLANENTGQLTVELNARGSGLTSDSIAAKAEAKIHGVVFNDYTYKNIALEAEINHEQAFAVVRSDDPNLQMDMTLQAGLNEKRQTFDLEADLHRIDFQALNFSEERIELKTKINVNGHYTSMDDMAAKLEILHTEIRQKDGVVPVEPVFLDATIAQNDTQVVFESEIADLNLTGNVSLAELNEVLQNSWLTYAGKEDADELPNDKAFEFSMDFHPESDLLFQLIPGLETMEINTFSGNYNSAENQLNVNFKIPHLEWQVAELEDFFIEIRGQNDKLDFSVGFEQLIWDTISFGNFSVTEKLQHGEITSEIRIKESNGQPSYFFNNAVVIEDDRMTISFLPDGLIIDGKNWDIPQSHHLALLDEKIEADNFRFSHEEQSIAVETSETGMLFTTTQFKLANLFNLLNFKGEEGMIRGNLNSKFEFIGSEDQDSTRIDLTIDEFYFMDSLIGDIFLTAQQAEELLTFDFELKHPLSEILVEGSVTTKGELPVFDLSGKLNIEELGLFQPFTFGQITQLEGGLFGEMQLTGTTDKPQVSGSLNFKEAAMNVQRFNFLTLLKDETIRFDREGVHLNRFTIRDEEMRELQINGSVYTRNYTDFRFDLGIETDRFQPVNSTSDDNEMLYGTLFLGTDIKITGTNDLPVIRSEITIDKGTDLTYVLPGSEIELITPEGVVHFVSPGDTLDFDQMSKPGDYLTDSVISEITGVDLSTNLQLHPEAKFTVILDPVSGDYLSIGGEANLNFTIGQGGSQSLTGVFEVKQGTYQLSFYGLVKKSFSFEPGSNISWSGDIMDASINLTAKHTVRTSSEELMANETSGSSQNERNMFRQRLPYEVLLHIKGFLSEPEVSFNIRLPERYMVNYPQIASKLNMLNSEHSESELNKQVFALLVIGGFMPAGAGGGEGVTGIATSAARNSVTGILTQQLNNLSSRYIRGFDVEFDLQSYEDYSGGTGETRTELDVQVSRSFFNDRLTIEASGTVDLEGDQSRAGAKPSQQMHGEFAVIYDITESGDLRLKAFRENVWDIFDGEVSSSGIAFIIQRSFNRWKKKQADDQKQTIDELPEPDEKE